MADTRDIWQSALSQLSSNKTRFKPYSGKHADLEKLPYEDGAIYFAYDSGTIFMDKKVTIDGTTSIQRFVVGNSGGGSSSNLGFVYANADEEDGTLFEIEDEESEDQGYYIYRGAFEADLISLPAVDTLVINSNGWLFRVIKVQGPEDRVLASLISTGSGGGTGPVNVRDLDLTYTGINLIGSTYVYGKSYDIIFYPSSDADEVVSLKITATDNTGKNPDVIRTFTVTNGSPCKFNANLLPLSNDISVTALVTSVHSEYNKKRGYSNTFPVQVLDMHLERHSESNFISVQSGNASLACIPYFKGLGTETNPVRLYYSIDSGAAAVGATLVSTQNEGKVYVTIPHQPHGTHTVTMWLGVTMDGLDFTSDSIVYEVPFVDAGNDSPLIWVKQDLGTVIQYEEAVIEYMVYSSVDALNGRTIEVQFLKDGVVYNAEEVQYSASKWLTLDLTANYSVGRNTFAIACGSTIKNIEFQVTSEGARDLTIKYPQELEINFDSMGRSSKEIKANRSVWKSSAIPTKAAAPYEAQLNGFNWYNNGWKNDEDGFGSYLAIANGASVTIPMSTITVNTADQPWTFELRFRVRNAKKFATLVTEIPIYKYILNGKENTPGEEKTLEEIERIGAQVKIDKDGNMEMNEANTTIKTVQTDKYIAFKYLNASSEGFVIGTQEAYFNTSGKTVNVKYKEDEIISIAFVVDKAQDRLSIYLNGILSGVANLSGIPGFTMQNIPFTINSEYCDFDLYKFRVYPKALTMPDIIHNYIADIKSLDTYDENQLTNINDDTALDYAKLIAFNADHVSSPSMPYAVIDMTATEQGTDLPHYKGAKRNVRIEFTNPTADYLLDSKGCTAYQYYTRSPSYAADNVELNVQGTSSQIYPRRNFKTKFKKAKNWVFTHGPLVGKSIAEKYYFNKDGSYAASTEQQEGESDEDYKARVKTFGSTYLTLAKKWHMDSEEIGVNKFTWKIDYMESSGSYNTGFANLMGNNIYNKHPLEDLHLSGIDTSIYRTTVYGFPMLVFHKTDDDQYTYIGRYNMNLDKSANERYGFEEEVEQPYLTYQDSDGNNYHPLIKDVAECWELRDNQGTWCSFRYPEAMRADKFGAQMADATPENPKIEVVQHFEARYNAQGDEFEWGQNVILGKENTEDYSSVVGTDNTAICSFLRHKLSNFEILFNWLDSTDTRSATNAELAEAVTLKVNGKLSDEAAEEKGVSYFTETNSDGVTTTYGRFTKDSTEYRRQKFYAEFEKHLDLHYCAIYFVMTELLLCYDSRGKNMMICSFGPHEEGGDYIWYPIFYDIDTQLGLNNVGAKLWDYDEDCSENGTFSTAQSVLWTNFYDLFRNTIISTYRSLRNGKLSYETIEGAYICDPKIFSTSFAMRGRRPTIAIGLDEYYKYVLPVTQAWKNQEGNMITADYLYACQGDRKLSRELLITNRLLYMDSKWLGGTFTISSGGMAGIMFRSTANHQTSTSDIFIDSTEVAEGQKTASYPIPYYDATPEYYVTPYLNFYVTTFTDENTYQNPEPYNPDKYPNGIPTITTDSVAQSYKSGRVDQQLNYFAGSSYISSLGDLSTKYVNQVKIPNTPRLLDITIGSDVPGYKNGEDLNPFELYTGVDDKTGKPTDGSVKSLLNKIILSNLTSLTTFLDVRSPDKLTEFRALGTQLKYALFADGAPLKTVHLPNSVTRLIFRENKDLTKLLRQTPVVVSLTDSEGNPISDYTSVENPGPESFKAVAADPATYEGLFIDGITNYDAETMTGDTNVTEIDIEGDALGYGSYEILRNVVARKQGTNRDNRLRIKMSDVQWTPYVQVEYGETKSSSTSYWYLTDHSTYTPYTHEDSAWEEDTLNGRVYTYNANAGESIVTDLSLLDTFYSDYQSAQADGEINQFTNNIEAMLGERTYPAISGELYVANAESQAISELELTEKYNVCWPDLTIRAANVEESPAVKYVEIDAITQKEKQWDIKYSSDSKIVLTTKGKPTRAHYDFIGWSPDRPGTNNPVIYVQRVNDAWVLTDEGAAAVIPSDTKTLVLYAIFEAHEYVATFDYGDGVTVVTVKTKWSTTAGLNAPMTIPTKPYPYADTELTPSGEYGLYRTYRFKGWAFVGDEEEKAQDLSILRPEHDYAFVATYEDASVYDNILDTKYLVYDMDTQNGGYAIGLNFDYHLTGKITLPTMINNVPVVRLVTMSGNTLQGNNGARHTITHIFWAQDNRALKVIGQGAFLNSTSLIYYEQPATCEVLSQNAFNGCERLGSENLMITKDILGPIKRITGSGVFSNCAALSTFYVPGHSYNEIASSAFSGMAFTSRLELGGKGDPCLWEDMLGSNIISISQNIFGRSISAQQTGYCTIYTPDMYSDELLSALGLSGNMASNVTWSDPMTVDN